MKKIVFTLLFALTIPAIASTQDTSTVSTSTPTISKEQALAKKIEDRGNAILKMLSAKLIRLEKTIPKIESVLDLMFQNGSDTTSLEKLLDDARIHLSEADDELITLNNSLVKASVSGILPTKGGVRAIKEEMKKIQSSLETAGLSILAVMREIRAPQKK